MSTSEFAEYVERWKLIPDGEPIATRVCKLLPVRRGSEPAMLKLAFEEEERRGPEILKYWNGEGAARVLEYEGHAVLLERVIGDRSLAEMTWTGQDDEATRIICAVAAKLHAPRRGPRPELIPLEIWFAALGPQAQKHGGVLTLADQAVRELFAAPQDVTTLHGDLHHDNVLDGGTRGWLAIDPKRLIGERGFDFANIFCNPDVAEQNPFRTLQTVPVATALGRFPRQLRIASEAADLEPQRLLKWVLAYCGLSAAWHLEDGNVPHLEFAIAGMAAAELGLA